LSPSEKENRPERHPAKGSPNGSGSPRDGGESPRSPYKLSIVDKYENSNTRMPNSNGGVCGAVLVDKGGGGGYRWVIDGDPIKEKGARISWRKEKQ